MNHLRSQMIMVKQRVENKLAMNDTRITALEMAQPRPQHFTYRTWRLATRRSDRESTGAWSVRNSLLQSSRYTVQHNFTVLSVDKTGQFSRFSPCRPGIPDPTKPGTGFF